MSEPKLGITFRETMAGAFALGESDPRAGQKRGESEGTELAIHVTIHIHDLDRFLTDPHHEAGLTGHIDFPPFGRNLPASRGLFNLFSPGEDPKLKLMVYELAFEHGGKSYYLAGRKEVRDDQGFDLWKDTTTLFTRLHEGRDKTGPVVGAGILSLGAADLVSLASTLRATNADSATERARALAEFGRFFLGNLWGTYAKHVRAEE